jgi:hypothetical protein
VHRFTIPGPIDAGLYTPEAEAEYAREGLERAKKLQAECPPGRQSNALYGYANAASQLGVVTMFKATEPFRARGEFHRPTESERRKDAAAADANVLAAVARQEADHVRAEALSARYKEPGRRSNETIWNGYLHGVTSIAFTKGNGEAEFVRKWRDLIAAIIDTDDDVDARVLESRLNRLTAPVTYPVLPEAAWMAADTYNAGDREAEYVRLEQLYGPRYGTETPATNTNGTAKRTLRKTRSLTAV